MNFAMISLLTLRVFSLPAFSLKVTYKISKFKGQQIKHPQSSIWTRIRTSKLNSGILYINLNQINVLLQAKIKYRCPAFTTFTSLLEVSTSTCMTNWVHTSSWMLYIDCNTLCKSNFLLSYSLLRPSVFRYRLLNAFSFSTCCYLLFPVVLPSIWKLSACGMLFSLIYFYCIYWRSFVANRTYYHCYWFMLHQKCQICISRLNAHFDLLLVSQLSIGIESRHF